MYAVQGCQPPSGTDTRVCLPTTDLAPHPGFPVSLRCCEPQPDTCFDSICTSSSHIGFLQPITTTKDGQDVTYVEARTECEAWGKRLCTADELEPGWPEKGVCCGTGCGHDLRFVWTGTACPAPAPPPPPPPLPPPSLSRLMVNGCRAWEPQRQCVSQADLSTETASIRCCEPTPNVCFNSVCASSVHPLNFLEPITTNKDGTAVFFAEAEAECSARGKRLCDADELNPIPGNTGGLCCGSGCGHDNRYVWTSTLC